MMDYYSFRQQFYDVRENRRAIKAIMARLATLEDDILGSVYSGAVDYSKDRIQATHDPDAAIINASETLRRDYDRMMEKLGALQASDERIEELIFSIPGAVGEIFVSYFIYCKKMEDVANELNYTENHCWKLRREKFDELYDKEVRGYGKDV
jgi:ABC-type cobalt transport system substrate-binding protein